MHGQGVLDPEKQTFSWMEKAKMVARNAKLAAHSDYTNLVERKTTLNSVMKKKHSETKWSILKTVGKFIQSIDRALRGKHSRQLYNIKNKEQANILAQLRTGMSCLNDYLFKIGAVNTDQCICVKGVEIVRHYLFTALD